MLMKLFILTVVCIIIPIHYIYCKDVLVEVEDFKKLDEKIASFLKNPNKEGWEDNLKDIEFFDQSLKNMILTLNGTFEGLTKSYYQKAEKFVNYGKPLFIDTDVVEYEIQPVIKVTDEQLNKLYWQRLYCEQDWDRLTEMVILKKPS